MENEAVGNIAANKKNRVNTFIDNSTKKPAKKYLIRGIAINIIGFLLGRASILGGITPFGIAYYSALSEYKLNKAVIFISIVLGILSIGFNIAQLKYILAMIMFLLLSIIYPSNSTIKNAIKVTISIFIVGTAICIYNNFLLYDFILNIFEAFLGGLLALIFKNAIKYFSFTNEEKTINNEQIISITIISTLAITGLANVIIFGFDIRNVMIISIILIFAIRNGAGIAGAIGIIAGLIISMSAQISPVIIGVYGFCALIAGVFKDLGKIGVILAFIFANSLITIYLNGSTAVLISILDILGAAGIIMLMPENLIKKINNYFIKPSLILTESKEKSNKLRQVTIDKLSEIAYSFKTVASTFEDIESKNKNFNREDVSSLFEEVAERVCRECSLNYICWHKDFYNTYQAMFEMLEAMNTKSALESADIPTYFKDKCIKSDAFIKNTNFMYELFTLNKHWEKKANESKFLISQQIEGLAQIIDRLANDINTEINFKPQIEENIYNDLARKGIDVDEILVIENKDGRIEVTIAHDSCAHKRVCNTNIIPIISKVTGRKMTKTFTQCENEKKCILKLQEKENYKVTTGIAMSSKDEISGDSCKIIELDGKIIITISDGMGSGEAAYKESNSALELLETFLKNGFERDIAIKLINSILILKSTQECFTTIDMCIVDLFTAEAEFAKIGAATTFIKSGEKIETIKSTSLPVGILRNVEIEQSKRDLEDGDLVIMVSDGILESRADLIKKEDWIINELKMLQTKNPQEIAEHILNMALCNLECNKDDMTVLVFKISEKL